MSHGTKFGLGSHLAARPARRGDGTPFIALLCVAVLFAAYVAEPAHATWQAFSTADGLGSNDIESFMQDRSGTYWATGSLRRYDGKTWSRFVFPDGLDVEVTAILQDRSGGLWFGRGSFVVHFDGANWSSFLCGGHISSIIEDRDGNIWVGTFYSGICRFDGSTWTTYDTSNGLRNNYVRDIVADRSGNVWVAFGVDAGAARFDGTTWRTFSHANGLPSDFVYGLAVDHSNNVWFATLQGVTRFDGSTWRTFTVSDGLPGDFVSSVAEDRFGNIWAGTYFAGVARFDGHWWRSYGPSDGMPAGAVNEIDSDRLGNVWFCTRGSGLVRFDGSDWKHYSVVNNPETNAVTCSLEDHSGKLWFGTLWAGVRCFDGKSWTAFTTAEGLASNEVRDLAEDSNGVLWVATRAGANFHVASTWGTLTTNEGLGSNDLVAIAVGPTQDIWFGAQEAVTRYDRLQFETFINPGGISGNSITTIAEGNSGDMLFGGWSGIVRYNGGRFTRFGELSSGVSDIARDASGNIWIAEQGANMAARFDGVSWTHFKDPAASFSHAGTGIAEGRDGVMWVSTYGDGIAMIKEDKWRSFSSADGLGNSYERTILVDRGGDVWVGTDDGISRYTPDRVAPRTVVIGQPAPITTARDGLVTFGAAFGETRGIEFSTRFDGQAWSEWGPASSWSASGLLDGRHMLEIQSRDHSLNVEASPPVVSFEVDATPPAPVLASPTFDQVIRGQVSIVGSAEDTRFLRYSVAVRPEGATSWEEPQATVLAVSSVPVVSGTLATWNTTLAPDGAYEIRVAVIDSLGLSATAPGKVIVDNQAPFADVTAPVEVTAATGGDVYTTNGEAHLYFPPHAFARDAEVKVMALDASTVPASPAPGVVKVLDGYQLAWSAALEKPARFTLSYAGAAVPAGVLAIYRSPDGSSWERLGGTIDLEHKALSLAVSHSGRYSLFADNGFGPDGASLSSVACTPRVFSPTGAFADRQVGISFRLGRPAPVTVKVFSRSGRLIREVAAGLQLNAGDNLVRWDGTDRNGGQVADGVYLVTVEALGHTETKTLAVVK